ncbi:hypothetical protein [Paludibaculum fermentans]|uniref:hypothetical protein n=1 Tax=Paludibaculum fermentans TaxID=1473598 RepID=UPI003EB7BBF6
MMTSLPDESVEGLLFAFNSAVNGLDATGRASAIEILQSSAGACSDATRRDRLMQAAEALSIGAAAGTAAKIPEAARGVTQQEWDEKWAPTFLPPPEADPEEEAEEEQEEYDEEDLEVEEADDTDADDDEDEEEADEEDDED